MWFLVCTTVIGAIWLFLVSFDHAVGSNDGEFLGAFIPALVSASMFLALGLNFSGLWFIGLALIMMPISIAGYRLLFN